MLAAAVVVMVGLERHIGIGGGKQQQYITLMI